MTFYSYIAVFLMFLVSGTVLGSMLHASVFIYIFFIYSIFFAFKSKIKYGHKELIFFGIYSLCLLCSCLFVGEYESNSFNMVIGFLLLATGALNIMQSIDYNKFRYIYLNIATFIAFTSIILFLLQQQNLIPLHIEEKAGVRYLMFLYNNFGWDYPFDRLAGPYWEPGAFQIILNYVLIMYFNEICNFSFSVPYGKLKILIIIAALLMTQSTAGYINLFILIVITVLNMKMTKKTFMKAIFIGIALIAAAFFLLSSETYTEKMSQKGSDNTSYEIRKMDNLAMLQMTMERPILGYGINSPAFRNRGKHLGNITSSNGLLALSSQLGCIFLLFFCLALYSRLKKFYPQKRFLVFFLLLMLQATEVFVFFPIAFIFFFAKIKMDKISQENQYELENSIPEGNNNI